MSSEHDNQIQPPPSFVAVYADAHQRLRTPIAVVRDRYEVCEDLACQLVTQAEHLYHAQEPSESAILLGFHTALRAEGAGVSPLEATWVVCRLAELLSWECPALPEPTDGAEAA